MGTRFVGRGPRASPAAAPLPSAPGPPLSPAWRRPHCSRPTLASSQPPAAGGSKSVVPGTAAPLSGRVQRTGPTSRRPGTPLTTFLLVLAPLALVLEVAELLWGDTQVPT